MVQKFQSILFLTLLAMTLSFTLSGQILPVCHYSFDNDDLSESTGNFLSGQAAESTVTYTCGVGENSRALLFDGSVDTLTLDQEVRDLFDEDFSFSMSFWVDPTQGNYSLFAIEDSCRIDSSFAIIYSGDVNQVQIEFARDISESVIFSAPLNTTRCWHDLIFIRDQNTYSFYLDNELIRTTFFAEEIVLAQNAAVEVGFSECVPLRDNYFSGRIDDIKVFDVAIDVQTVEDLSANQDQIISQDTTIFEGDAYQILAGPTCANTVSWNPGAGLDRTDITTPIASPTQTTQYFIEYDHGSCISSDSVSVFVINEEDIDCGELLLPSAFTPNGDLLNDTYGISNNFIIESLDRFEIFDRWGTKLFETVDKNATWDGTYKGESLMPSSYVYKIEYSCMNSSFQKSGRFNLIK